MRLGRLLRDLDDRAFGPGGSPPPGRRLEDVNGPGWLRPIALVGGLVALALILWVGPEVGLVVILPLLLAMIVIKARYERQVRLAWEQERKRADP